MPELAQTDFDALGGFRLIAARYGGTPQGIENHIRSLEERIPGSDQLIVPKADADALRAYRALGSVEEIQAKFVKEGQVVVPKNDADELALYRLLGKPEELKTKLAKGEQDATALQLAETRVAATSFARAAGLAEETVDTLIAVPSLHGAKFEVRRMKVDDGKGGQVDKEVAYLTLPGDGQAAMNFDAAVEKLPLLKGLARATVASQDAPIGSGPSWAPQSGGGSAGSGSAGGGTQKGFLERALDEMGKNAAAPNALSVTTAAA